MRFEETVDICKEGLGKDKLERKKNVDIIIENYRN